MTGYFAGAGFSSESGQRSAYQNKARRNLAVWAWLGLLGGAAVELLTFLALTTGQAAGDGWTTFWLILGFVLIAIGVASWAGSAVVRAMAYENEYRFGPLAQSPYAPAELPRAPRLDDESRHAGTEEDPIPVEDNFIR